ncbi:hypothetical protein ACWCQS_06710 [Streptomyces sp. NPDC002076]
MESFPLPPYADKLAAFAKYGRHGTLDRRRVSLIGHFQGVSPR